MEKIKIIIGFAILISLWIPAFTDERLGSLIPEVPSCKTISNSAVAVGGGTAVDLVSTSSRRLWVEVNRFGYGSPATSTIYLALNDVNATTTSESFVLSSTTPLRFNQDNPYFGNISAVTSNGSTTLIVSSCNY